MAPCLDFWQSLPSDQYVLGIVNFPLRLPSCDSVFMVENTKHILDCIQELLGLAVIMTLVS